MSCLSAEPCAAQVVALLVLSVLFLAYLRLVRPMSERSALATAMGAGLLDTGSYVCGIILLSKPGAGQGFTCAPALPKPTAQLSIRLSCAGCCPAAASCETPHCTP